MSTASSRPSSDRCLSPWNAPFRRSTRISTVSCYAATANSRGFRAPPEGMIAVFDVFDETGVYIRQEQLPIDGNGVQDGIIFAGEDRLMLVKGFTDALVSLQTQGAGPTLDDDEEPAPMEVICYRLD